MQPSSKFVRAIPSKIPATKIPSTTAAKTQTEVTPNRAAVLKKKRAEDQLAKHKARMQVQLLFAGTLNAH